MKKLLLLGLFFALLPDWVNAFSLSKINPPTCDTLITMSGKTYLVIVGWQGNQEIQYQLCGDSSGRVYAIQRDSIRDLRKQKVVVNKEVTSASKRYGVPKDSFDLLTLTNGKTYRVTILVRDYLNTYYKLYDDPLDDREYCVLNREVQSVKLSKSPRTQKKKSNGCLIALAILLGLPLLLLVIGLSLN